MPTERERREQIAEWRAAGSHSPLDHIGCSGCFWVLAAVLLIFSIIVITTSHH
jgi:hypothetical protein